jgi:hypothetical protein
LWMCMSILSSLFHQFVLLVVLDCGVLFVLQINIYSKAGNLSHVLKLK